MKKISLGIGVLCCLLGFLWANSDTTPQTSQPLTNESTMQTNDKYPIKPHHQRLSLSCIHCHENQGTQPDKFEAIGDEGCVACHGSKKKIAERTKYMDLFHTNPHNSYHDGPTLSCDEGHKEHEPSQNRCFECHEKEVPNWMKKVAP